MTLEKMTKKAETGINQASSCYRTLSFGSLPCKLLSLQMCPSSAQQLPKPSLLYPVRSQPLPPPTELLAPKAHSPTAQQGQPWQHILNIPLQQSVYSRSHFLFKNIMVTAVFEGCATSCKGAFQETPICLCNRINSH